MSDYFEIMGKNIDQFLPNRKTNSKVSYLDLLEAAQK